MAKNLKKMGFKKPPLSLTLIAELLLLVALVAFFCNREELPPQGLVNKEVSLTAEFKPYESPQKTDFYKELTFPQGVNESFSWSDSKIVRDASFFLIDKGAVGDALVLLRGNGVLASYADDVKQKIYERGKSFLATALTREWATLQMQWQELNEAERKALLMPADFLEVNDFISSEEERELDLLALQKKLPEPLALALTINSLRRFKNLCKEAVDHDVYKALLPLLSMGYDIADNRAIPGEWDEFISYKKADSLHVDFLNNAFANNSFKEYFLRLEEEYKNSKSREKRWYKRDKDKVLSLWNASSVAKLAACKNLADDFGDTMGRDISPYYFYYQQIMNSRDLSLKQYSYLLQDHEHYKKLLREFDYNAAIQFQTALFEMPFFQQFVGRQKLPFLQNTLKKNLELEKSLMFKLAPWPALKPLLRRNAAKPALLGGERPNNWHEIDGRNFFLALKLLTTSANAIERNAALNIEKVFLRNRTWLLDVSNISVEQARVKLKMGLGI